MKDEIRTALIGVIVFAMLLFIFWVVTNEKNQAAQTTLNQSENQIANQIDSADFEWLNGRWKITMTSCLDKGGVPEVESTTCDITVQPANESGAFEAIISNNLSNTFDGLTFLIQDKKASLLSPETTMDGWIAYGSDNSNFSFYVESIGSSGGDKLILADYGFYTSMSFERGVRQLTGF